jgi:alpha-N-arabinofuranosidase
MGRCIYGGLYDPTNKNNLIDENGFRTDVIDCMKELQVPVVRYPGGNFVATYRWQDGLGTESNQFGTDEFMLWCEKVGAEPYLALNMGTGTLEDGEDCCEDSTTAPQLTSVSFQL